MELKKLDYDLTVCKVASVADLDISRDFFVELLKELGQPLAAAK